MTTTFTAVQLTDAAIAGNNDLIRDILKSGNVQVDEMDGVCLILQFFLNFLLAIDITD